MSLTVSILSRVFPPAPTNFEAVARAKGWPHRAEIIGEVLLQPIPGTDDFLTRDWQRPRTTDTAFLTRFHYLDGSTRDIVIPRGMRTDCGSIPRWLRNIEELSPTRWAGAYVPHNRIFTVRTYCDGRPIRLDEADWLLLLLLDFLEAPQRERTVIYRGLRVGSWVVWYWTGEGAKRKRKMRHYG